jgi:hypothetical protein
LHADSCVILHKAVSMQKRALIRTDVWHPGKQSSVQWIFRPWGMWQIVWEWQHSCIMSFPTILIDFDLTLMISIMQLFISRQTEYSAGFQNHRMVISEWFDTKSPQGWFGATRNWETNSLLKGRLEMSLCLIQESQGAVEDVACSLDNFRHFVTAQDPASLTPMWRSRCQLWSRPA